MVGFIPQCSTAIYCIIHTEHLVDCDCCRFNKIFKFYYSSYLLFHKFVDIVSLSNKFKAGFVRLVLWAIH